MNKGLIIINTGDGKGKTTAALGLTLRALGNGMKVVFRSFIKGIWQTGESILLPEFKELLDFKQLGAGFIRRQSPQKIAKLKKEIDAQFATVCEEIISAKAELFILDEVLNLVRMNLLAEDKLLQLLKNKPEKLHLVLTGRGATPGLIEAADLVTEMKAVKHPYTQGIKAQKGIEF